MRYQRLEVQNAVRQEAHGLRPRMVVAIDEFEIDLDTRVSRSPLVYSPLKLHSPPP
jgi:hypothetical protein